MKLLTGYFIMGLGESQELADNFKRDGEETLEATYRGQAEAYRLCLSYYRSVEENLEKFIKDMEVIKNFYKEVYMMEEDSVSYYSGLYLELYLILDEIK